MPGFDRASLCFVHALNHSLILNFSVSRRKSLYLVVLFANRPSIMIKDIIEQNSSVTPNVEEMAVLHRYFPSCFTNEGKFDIALFESKIKESVDTIKEGYSLNYLGKDYARLIASMDTTTVLVPDEEHNAKPENKNIQ